MVSETNPVATSRHAANCSVCHGTDLKLLQRIATAELRKLVEADGSIRLGSEFQDIDRLDYFRCRRCDLRFFLPAVMGSERFYEQLQALDFYYQPSKPEFDFARQFLRRDQALLEVGCGSGAFGAGVTVQRYVGLEFSAKAAGTARARGLTVSEESIEDHARDHGQAYDVVCTFQVLEHVARPDTFLQACIATLKPGGLLIVSVPSTDSFACGIPNFVLDMPPHHVTRWSDRCLTDLPRWFPVRLETLWHETLQPIHAPMYVVSVLNRIVYGLLANPIPAVETRRFARIVLSLNAKLAWILSRLLPARWLRGVSVTVVYRKAGA